MRRSAWPERATWKPWVVGLRITHVDEVLFRSTDVGLHVYLSMGTWPPEPYGVVIRGAEPETVAGALIVSGASSSDSPTSHAHKLDAALSSKEPMKQYLQHVFSGINGSGSPTMKEYDFEAGQSSGQLLNHLAQRLADGRWDVQRRGDSLICNAVANGGAPTYMSIYLRHGGESEVAEHAADWTWGLTLERR